MAAGAAAAADGPHVQERIVPGRSIGKVSLGMSLAQVKKALGAAESVISREPGPFGRQRIEYSWSFTEWRITFEVFRGRSEAVAIRSSVRGERTKEGVGYGTLATRVEQAFRTECKPTITVGFWRACFVKGPGAAKTFFVVNRLCGNVPTAGRCAEQDVRIAVTEVGVLAPGEKLPFIFSDAVPSLP
jgi:hypothetical protein